MTSLLEDLCGQGKPSTRKSPGLEEFEGLLRSGRARFLDELNIFVYIHERKCIAPSERQEEGPWLRKLYFEGRQCTLPRHGSREIGEGLRERC
jgi:hypothetical protein